jgi:hypothetical protein
VRNVHDVQTVPSMGAKFAINAINARTVAPRCCCPSPAEQRRRLRRAIVQALMTSHHV